MTKTIAPLPARFLEAEAIRGGMDLLMFAHKSHLDLADAVLEARGLGRAHHRVLYFVSRMPGEPVGTLLETLGITKQSLARVLRALTDAGLVEQRAGERDRRKKLLYLTPEGAALEHELFEQLHANMARAYAAAGEAAVAGYWTMMQHLMADPAHRRFTSFHAAASGDPAVAIAVSVA